MISSLQADQKADFLRAVEDGDIVSAAKPLGIDFTKVMKNCLDEHNKSRQVKSWKLLIWFYANGNFDGAAGEESWVVGAKLANLMPDERLAEIISKLHKEELEHLPFSLNLRFRYRDLSQAERIRIKATNPALFHAMELERARYAKRGSPIEADSESN